MNVDLTAGQAARKAAKMIETKGWNQGGWGVHGGAVCIRAAFNLTIWGILAMPPSDQEVQFSCWLSDLKVLPAERDLAGWNDDRARTKEEVLLYLHKFAEEQDPQPVLP